MKLVATVAAIAFLAAPSLSAPCRDAKGHFAKCPPPGSGTSGAIASKGAGTSSLPTGVTKDSKGRCHAKGGRYVACPA